MAMLDHDDELHPDALLEIVRLLNAGPRRWTSSTQIRSTSSATARPTGCCSSRTGRRRSFGASCSLATARRAPQPRAAVGGFDSKFDNVQDFEFMFETLRAHRSDRTRASRALPLAPDTGKRRVPRRPEVAHRGPSIRCSDSAPPADRRGGHRPAAPEARASSRDRPSRVCPPSEALGCALGPWGRRARGDARGLTRSARPT